MKVIPQEGAELLDPDPQVKAAGRVRATNPLRFAPLTGILMTDASGGLLVRRVRVRVTSGPDRGREALLEAGTLLVGTHSDNDLILRDPQVGKYHLEIALVAGGIRVRDLGSDGGTFVGSVKVQQSVLPMGTEVSLGRSTLQLLSGDIPVPVSPSERTSFGPVLGQSLSMRTVFALLERVAPSDAPVVLEGESGTGRSLIARAIHASSRFAASPMASIDFRLPSHERPTLSSLAQRTDTFTLLVDRIDKATPAEQTALLALYERREEGVLDARIIATSNIDIRREGAEGRFRKELVPHAAAVRIVVPPLRARAEDIPLLVRQFAREVCGAELDFENHDFDRLLARDYPGNVRELRQLIGKALQVDAPPLQLPKSGLARARAALVMPLNARPKPPPPAVARDRLVEFFERDHVEQTHKRLNGNIAEIGRALGLPRREVIKTLKRFSLACPDR